MIRGEETWRASIDVVLGATRLTVDIGGGAESVAIIGPNGAGKTSLLRTIAGALAPSAGSISIRGRTVFDSDAGVDLPPEERRVGYVPQGLGLFPHLTALQNVAFAKTSRTRQETLDRAARLMADMGCSGVVDRRIDRLSGGEAQRVALARALTTEPELLLLDEPLAALDATSRRSLRSFLDRHLRGRSLPTLLVSHDPADVRSLAGTVFVLEGGAVVQSGSPDELAGAPATDFVAEFFGA